MPKLRSVPRGPGRPFAAFSKPAARPRGADTGPGAAAEALEPRALLTAIDFSAGPIASHGGPDQDRGGTAGVEEGGAALRLAGNTWKSVALDATAGRVTADTVLTFDFAGPVEGEIAGIGFDTDAGLSRDRFFAVSGTQDWGVRDYASDGPAAGVTSYRIPVGRYFRGDFDRLVFANDHDNGPRDAVSVYSEVELFEEATPTAAAVRFDPAAVESYSAQDRAGAFAVDPDRFGRTLTLSGNVWKKVAAPVALTANSVLEFSARVPREGEIQAVGFTNDDSIAADRSFQFAGVQDWGIRADPAYAFSPGDATLADGGWVRYRVPVGESLTGAFSHVLFINDDDRAGTAAEATFADVRIYEAAEPTTVTVSTRSEFVAAVRAATAGTTILLNPGRYGGGLYFSGVRGEAGAPVTIAAADPANRPRFTGSGRGSVLQFSRVEYLTIRDLDLAGPADNGLNVDDGGAAGPPSAHVRIENVRVRNLGGGNRDGLKLSGVRDVEIRGVTLERWGTYGSGVDLVGCHDVLITGSTFRHDAGAADAGSIGGNGVQAKGGSTRVWVRGNRFEHAGARAVQIGGSTGSRFFRTHDGGPATAEASLVTVERNLIVGSRAAVAFASSDGGVVRYNTILNPGRWVFRILKENPSFPTARGRVERNVVQTDSRLSAEVNVGGGNAAGTFAFADNWFFHATDRRRSPGLPGTVTGTVKGVDPRLRDPAAGDLRPAAGPAAAYGAYATG